MQGRDVYIVDAVRTPVGRHGGALADVEGAETDQADRVTLLQCVGDRLDSGVQGTAGSGLGDVGLGGDGVDQFRFVHV